MTGAGNSVRVRFPPSPTGFCHVGTARMALINYMFARRQGGSIVFRIEDTDKERSSKEYEDDIVESVKWLGLDWDEFYRQSERTDLYVQALQKLIDKNAAYVSEEESKREAGRVVKVVRLKNPNKVVAFQDIVRGEISFDTTELKDFVIARAIDDPLYHLSVVVDDAQMGITHVIRGEEHISNTPRQILIQEALEVARPEYAHYPLFLGADKSKLSKRKGDVAVRDYREDGFLAEAMLNFIGILGWTPPSGKEILSLQEMVGEFDLKDLHKSGAVFDMDKLRWYNRQYLLKKNEGEFAAYALPALESALKERDVSWDRAVAEKILPDLKERISVASDISDSAAAGEFDFFFTDPKLDAARIPQKQVSASDTARHLTMAQKLLTSMPAREYADAERVKAALWEYAAMEGRGAVLWPLRYALTGLERSPDPFVVASIIGKETVLRRISAALGVLGETI